MILFVFLVIAMQSLSAQRIMEVPGYFVTRDNDTIQAKFIGRANLFNSKIITEHTFLDKIYYKSEDDVENMVRETDIKYLEYTDLFGRKHRYITALGEPLLEDKKKIHAILVEGKLSFYQALSYNSYDGGITTTDYMVRKDQGKIVRIGAFFTTMGDAFRQLMGEFDFGRFFTKENRLKTGTYPKVMNAIVFYNSKYGGTSYISQRFDPLPKESVNVSN